MDALNAMHAEAVRDGRTNTKYYAVHLDFDAEPAHPYRSAKTDNLMSTLSLKMVRNGDIKQYYDLGYPDVSIGEGGGGARVAIKITENTREQAPLPPVVKEKTKSDIGFMKSQRTFREQRAAKKI